ncbi:hypothetical protein LEL_09944 [Akanthomyces lecanii RCEF 1005]|uniref:Fungal transcriptional regulatory protein n=1 Tax=Akanthomyces lecanii RCEF 1005 TaxID=1081108 RepID=A0A168BHM8_CORDF|nr:hypothetical protein LEL_09944 [Akanthomyces lecanii RCEF 1005]
MQSPVSTFKKTKVNERDGVLPAPHLLISAEVQAPDNALWPSDDEANALLTIYTSTIGDLFPFVASPDLPAAEFRSTRPFLFKAMVMAASYHNRELQKRRARDFTISLTNCMLLEGYKSFDALQGLLVHISWYQCHVKRNSQLTNLLQLAIAALADLELNKPVHANDRRKLVYDVTRSSYGFTSETRELTNDERRALLGCYYLSSTASTIYRKIDALRFSQYMEDALEHLLASQERESDVLLYYLVRLQQIVQNITQAVPYDEPHAPHTCGAPLVMHIKMLDKSLSDFQSSLPASLRHHARIFLYEVSLYDAPWQGTLPHQRLDGLWSCVEAMHSFFKIFCAMPNESCITIPYALWGQLSHALLTSSRVCLVNIVGWDKSIMDSDKKFLPILDTVMNRLEASQKYAKMTWLGEADDAILERIISKFGWMRKWFEEHAGGQSTTGHETAPTDANFIKNGMQEIQESILMDSRFWEEIMAEYQILPETFMANSIPEPVLY